MSVIIPFTDGSYFTYNKPHSGKPDIVYTPSTPSHESNVHHALPLVADALDSLVRWRGQLQEPVTVAQHQLYAAAVARYMHYPTPVVLACLLHDWCEVFLGDAAYGVSAYYPALETASAYITDTVLREFGIAVTEDLRSAVDFCDRMAATYEVERFASPEMAALLSQRSPLFALRVPDTLYSALSQYDNEHYPRGYAVAYTETVRATKELMCALSK